MQIADWREEVLNDILYGAWEQYVEALGSGEKLELEGDYKEWVRRALDDTGLKSRMLPKSAA